MYYADVGGGGVVGWGWWYNDYIIIIMEKLTLRYYIYNTRDIIIYIYIYICMSIYTQIQEENMYLAPLACSMNAANSYRYDFFLLRVGWPCILYILPRHTYKPRVYFSSTIHFSNPTLMIRKMGQSDLSHFMSL